MLELLDDEKKMNDDVGPQSQPIAVSNSVQAMALTQSLKFHFCALFSPLTRNVCVSDTVETVVDCKVGAKYTAANCTAATRKHCLFSYF